MGGGSKQRDALAAGLLVIWFGVSLHAPRSLQGQTSQPEQNPAVNWWPTRGVAPRADYVGPEVCAECHPTEAASQKTTLMAHAATSGAESEILRAHPRLSFRLDRYSYQITREGDRSIYTVSDGTRNISAPLPFAFGFGAVGQTYLIEWNGWYYESRVTYYTAIQGLDITLGHHRSVPMRLEDAIGDRQSPREVTRCFSCHTTAAVTNDRLDVSHLIPGVTCEACHSPGAKHVAAMKAGKIEHPLIFNPARLKAEELVNFCGACHRTLEEVISFRTSGPKNVRFQPYRLVSSRCWNPQDSRISCIACHNPHEQLQRNPAFYDSRCLACHLSRAGVKQTRDHPGGACPVSDQNCVTCHMPKTELAGSHFKFADHWIRAVRPGEPYPD